MMCFIGLFCWFYLRIEVVSFRANLCTLPQSRGPASTENIMNLFFLNSGILTVVYIEHCVEIFFYTICILYYEVSNYVEQAFDARQVLYTCVWLGLVAEGMESRGFNLVCYAWLHTCFKFSSLAFVSVWCTKACSSWMQVFFCSFFYYMFETCFFTS